MKRSRNAGLNVPKCPIYIDMSSDIRLPQILEKQIVEGKTKTQIAHDLGVNRKTITRDTKTPLYELLRNVFVETYITRILEFANSEKDTFRLEGNKEIGRMLRQGMTKTTRHTEDIKLTADLTITEQRKELSNIVDSLELSSDQYKILDARFKTVEKEES